MNILISTGIYPPDPGGPANYAKQLTEEFTARGHRVQVATYRLEKRLPPGVRHVYFFLKILPRVFRSDAILILDTFSVALPTYAAGVLLRKKMVVRTGGDYLWEWYVERTKEKILLSEFYAYDRQYTAKERFVFSRIRHFLSNVDRVVFSTAWQRDIFLEPYGLDLAKTTVIENFYGEKKERKTPTKKNFIWVGRRIEFKNLDVLQQAFKYAQRERGDLTLEVLPNMSRDEVLEQIKSCYAVIYPSLSEISPNTVMESLMYRKPFITTRDTGIYERIRDVGTFVDPKDPHDIAKKMLALADDAGYEEQLQKLDAHSFSHSYSEIADAFLNLFTTLHAAK